MRHPSRRLAPGCVLLCFQNGCESYSPKGPEKVNITTLNRYTADFLGPPHGTTIEVVISYPLEIQHPKKENSRLGLIESVHER